MSVVSQSHIGRVAGRVARRTPEVLLLCLGLTLQCVVPSRAKAEEKPKPNKVQVTLTEWKVSLTPKEVPPGPVVFEVSNSGKIPHALEIEGRGREKSTSAILPGARPTLP